MQDDKLVSAATQGLYLHDLDAETLRWLSDSLEDYAEICRVWEKNNGPNKLRHAGSALLRLWAGRFRTDAKRLEVSDGMG